MAVSSLAGCLESITRRVIQWARVACPAPLREIGIPVGVYPTTEDWAREAAQFDTAGVFVPLEKEQREFVVEISVRHLPEQTHPGFGTTRTYIDRPTFVACLQNARVMGRNGYVVASTGKILGDVPKVYRNNYTPDRHPALASVRPAPVSHLPGTSAELAVFSTGNYYHWMFEALPRLELLRQAGCDLDKIDWFIVNERENQFVQPSLEVLGIPEQKLRVTRDGHAWKCETLLVPSMPFAMDPAPWVCAFLRSHFLPKTPPAPSRIFVSRAPGARRRIANEDEVEALLGKYGFRKVYLENCSLAEQVALFAGAEFVVGVHGASMANLVFCSPGAKVIEIFHPEYTHILYWTVARQASLDYGYLLGEGNFTGFAQNTDYCGDDIAVSTVNLERLLGIFEL